MNLGIILLTFFAGCAATTQPAVNAVLARIVGSPYVATFLSLLTGTLIMGALSLATRSAWPTAQTLLDAPWWAWMGGPVGALIVGASLTAIPKLGAMNVVALLIAGQVLVALLTDHYGWMGVSVHPVSPLRILGAIMLLAGVVLVRKF